MIAERQVNEWTCRTFESPTIYGNMLYKVIAVRGEGKARQVRVYTKLSAAEAESLTPSWS